MREIPPKRPIQKPHRSHCPISRGLDILGDKWSLLIVRDMLMDATTYSELQNGLESIPTNILASRLKRLLKEGIIKKTAYQKRPVRYRYELTEKGQDLAPLMKELLRWSNKHIADTKIPEKIKHYL